MPHTKPSPKRVLIFIDYFIPGYRAGGILRSVYNLVKQITDIDFFIVTRDKDLGEKQPYPGIEKNQWIYNSLDNVMYLSPKKETIRDFYSIIKEVHPDYLYLHSVYSIKYSILPIIIARLFFPKTKLILAANGMLSKEAIQLKWVKKRVFLTAARVLGIFRKVGWHATNIAEKADIIAVFGKACIIKIAPYIVDFSSVQYSIHVKNTNELKLFYFSRISEKKNLLGALEILEKISCPVQFSIFGPIEDQQYFKKCQELINRLPANISVVIRGDIPFHDILPNLEQFHFLLFPTIHENFGHVIIESMLAGNPVIISNRTPFKNLPAEQIGWDLPLDNWQKWVSVINHCYAMDQTTYTKMSRAAFDYAVKTLNDPGILQANRDLFT